MITSIVLVSISLLTTLVGVFYINKNVTEQQKATQKMFSEALNQLNVSKKEFQSESSEIKDSLDKIRVESNFTKESMKDMNAHDKMTDVMLTKIKSDLAKIINLNK